MRMDTTKMVEIAAKFGIRNENVEILSALINILITSSRYVVELKPQLTALKNVKNLDVDVKTGMLSQLHTVQ